MGLGSIPAGINVQGPGKVPRGVPGMIEGCMNAETRTYFIREIVMADKAVDAVATEAENVPEPDVAALLRAALRSLSKA